MSDKLNPDDFVITRRRKKYKFAKFTNAENCFEFDEWVKRPIDVVEIGAGTGLFSVELAARYPEQQFLALDVKADRMQKGAYAALERNLDNIYFVRARADQLAELTDEHTLSAIWLNFADPFPRSRSAGRRMTHPRFLSIYASALDATGILHIKHDNADFFSWTLEQLVASGWRLTDLAFDVHESEARDDARIMTTYEKRWHEDGRTTSYVEARHG